VVVIIDVVVIVVFFSDVAASNAAIIPTTPSKINHSNKQGTRHRQHIDDIDLNAV